MLNNDTTKILKKTEKIIDKFIFLVQKVVSDTGDSAFKMLLINSMETMKEHCELLKQKLREIQNDNEIVNEETNHSSDDNAFPDFPESLSDRQIAHFLFDVCNASVKKIYTYLNHYKGIDEKIEKVIKESVKSIERLREHLAEYL